MLTNSLHSQTLRTSLGISSNTK